MGNSASEQNASIISALLMDRGAVNVAMNLVPILLNGGLPVVIWGMPPFDWWEPPPRHGRVPERRTDSGTFLTAEAFGCRQVIYVKDQDGSMTATPSRTPTPV